MKSVLREPLVHFMVLGALLFAVHRWVSPAPPGRRIDVTADVVAGLRAEHQRTTGIGIFDRKARVGEEP